MIMLFAFRMNAEADEEHFSNGSDAMVGGAVTQNDKFQVKHGDYS